MKRKSVIALVAIAICLQSGCLWAPGLDRLREEIEDQLPGARFEKEFAISLGPITLGLVRLVTALVPPAHEAREYLREVSRVKVAVYKAENVHVVGSFQTPARLASLLEDDDWELAARVNEGDGQIVWVLCRSRDDEVREIFVVALGEEELVLVRASGNIEKLAAKAMKEHRRGGRYF